ncbi:TetR/AcrR family transcriptional regulator [Maribacter sp. BPC-D8]|uniref:TetR/AcrR family transcriptional regulator n=1 Tax=Maribacter sp. BPC-D8 TaxID=3053613 RepID=UPI002B45A521|nr:TetR/AcrR family transcriptional regulator [Maribacter sp. BPC-D8]WRI27893.1 TetR/AcrR family transcriptional regulator [Maribacter sp. BPC-D8]
MARKKQYNETEVIEKAMRLFWRNGYESTSVRMLEKEMGINQFSIYASFKNKEGVFLESIKFYNAQIKSITDTLEKSNNGVLGIKAYFFDFLEFSREGAIFKGCLVTNTVNEIKEDSNPTIMAALKRFSSNIRELFVRNLKQDDERHVKEIEVQADYLMNALLGLSISSKVFSEDQLQGIIEMTFLHL